MARVDVTAKEGCLYDGVPRLAGEVFDCELSDAKVLKLIGKVEFSDATVKQLEAEELAASTPSRRRYKRRDMTAEG